MISMKQLILASLCLFINFGQVDAKQPSTLGGLFYLAKESTPESSADDEKELEMVRNIFFALLICFIGLFFIVEAVFEKYKPPFGHTTGVIVVFGILMSFAAYNFDLKDHLDGDEILSYLRFNAQLFFNIILPLIVFPSGYNMRRKKFFQNIGTITKFGFVATLVCCGLYSLMFWGAWKAGLMVRYHPECDPSIHNELPKECRSGDENGYLSLDIGFYEILSLCSLLCSSDVIAAISMLDYNESPKLFSIVYGEGVFNDIVSIILFGVVQHQFPAGETPPEFKWFNVFSIAWDFIVLAFKSVGIGLFFGFISSLLFKKYRLLAHSAISETIIIMVFGFLSYFIAENSSGSSIISMLACGVTMAHYTWFNLSPQGKTISSVTFSITGSLAEALVFIYIGVCVFTYYNIIDTTGAYGPKGDYTYPWAPQIILIMTFIVIIGRVTAVWSIHYLFTACSKEADIIFRELIFISYGGMIRGAIAFGLVLKIPSGEYEKEIDGVMLKVPIFRELGTMYTTTLALVIITTVVFGSFMPLVQKCLFPKVDDVEFEIEEQNETSINSNVYENQKIGETANKVISGNFNKDILPSDQLVESEEHHEEMVHPNDERDDEEEGEENQNRGFKYYFNKLDSEILRPILIYNYNAKSLERQEQYVEMLQNDKDAMFKVYGALRETKKGSMAITDRVTQAVVALAGDVKKRKDQNYFNAQKEELNNYRLTGATGNYDNLKNSIVRGSKMRQSHLSNSKYTMKTVR